MTTQPITVTADTFASEVLESPIPVVVDFWAPWCGPCRVMNPIVTQLTEEYGDVIKVAKINVDEAEAISSKYHITAIPTLLIFQEGNVVERIPGLATKETIVKRLQGLDILSAIAA